jgi:hypothetical protein
MTDFHQTILILRNNFCVAKQKVRRNCGNAFPSTKLCLFWQDLNLAHDAEERRAVVAQLTLDISLAANVSSINPSYSAWLHVSKIQTKLILIHATRNREFHCTHNMSNIPESHVQSNNRHHKCLRDVG